MFGIFFDNCFGEVGEQVFQFGNPAMESLNVLVLHRKAAPSRCYLNTGYRGTMSLSGHLSVLYRTLEPRGSAPAAGGVPRQGWGRQRKPKPTTRPSESGASKATEISGVSGGAAAPSQPPWFDSSTAAIPRRLLARAVQLPGSNGLLCGLGILLMKHFYEVRGLSVETLDCDPKARLD
jgi:hypothetical protein